jgi:predicted dinucleotide-binding enzyme
MHCAAERSTSSEAASMTKGKKISFIGAGNMAEAMVRGLLKAGAAAAADITATDKREDQLEMFAKTFGVHVTSNNFEAASSADVIVLAVKPQAMGKVLDDIAPAVDANKLVVSPPSSESWGAAPTSCGRCPTPRRSSTPPPPRSLAVSMPPTTTCRSRRRCSTRSE